MKGLKYLSSWEKQIQITEIATYNKARPSRSNSWLSTFQVSRRRISQIGTRFCTGVHKKPLQPFLVSLAQFSVYHIVSSYEDDDRPLFTE